MKYPQKMELTVKIFLYIYSKMYWYHLWTISSFIGYPLKGQSIWAIGLVML